MLDAEAGAEGVVHGHQLKRQTGQGAVERHYRYLQRAPGGDELRPGEGRVEQDAVDPLLEEHLQVAVLDLGAVPGAADDDAVVGALAGLLHSGEDDAPVGMGDVGEEDADEAGTTSLERARGQVRHIAELLDRGLDPDPGRCRDGCRVPVEVAGDSGDRDPGLTGYVGDRRTHGKFEDRARRSTTPPARLPSPRSEGTGYPLGGVGDEGNAWRSRPLMSTNDAPYPLAHRRMQ